MYLGESLLKGQTMKDIKTKLQSILANGYDGETVYVYGEKYNTAELAKQHGIELPKGKKPKKQVNKTEDIQEEAHADMDKQDDSGDTEES
jgi:hypothetical protein